MPLIDPGKKIPAFKLTDHTGNTYASSDFAGRPFVLYFYPKDDTTDCTKQACAFRDHLPDFSKLDCPVLAISPDDAKSHAAFGSKHKLTFPILVDPRDKSNAPRTCDAFGVWAEKSMYGRKYMGIIRTTYLIGPDAKVVRRWDKVKITDHVPEVLAAVKAFSTGQLIEPKPAAKKRSTKKPVPKPTKKPARSK